MPYTLTSDWNNIQKRNIDPHSPFTSENHNGLLKILSKHKAYIGGLDLSFIYDTDENRIVAELSEGKLVLNYMCIDFIDKPIFIMVECPSNEQDFYILAEYEYSTSLPQPVASIKVMPTSLYNPDVHLILYYFHTGSWDTIPTETEFTSWIANEANFKDYRYEAESLPEWAAESFLLKRGDTILGTVLTPDPTENKQVANKQYVDDSLETIDLSNYVRKDGDQMEGTLTLYNHPDNSSYQPLISKQAATKGYVDYWVNYMISALGEEFAAGPYLPVSGGQMTGYITLHANPTDAFHAATKQYVDDNLSLIADDVSSLETTVGDLSYLPLSGGTMTGYITLHNNPTDTMHPATKQYVDNTFVLLTNYDDSDVLAKVKNVDGAGSGLDADLLDGQNGSYYLASSSYTAADILNKIKTVDGSGSGLDADLLDGHNASSFLEDTAHSFGTNGYQKFSNGLIIQWGYVNNASRVYSISWPVSFPHACLQAVIGLGSNHDMANPAIYSLSSTGAVVNNEHGNVAVVMRYVAFGY